MLYIGIILMMVGLADASAELILFGFLSALISFVTADGEDY